MHSMKSRPNVYIEPRASAKGQGRLLQAPLTIAGFGLGGKVSVSRGFRYFDKVLNCRMLETK